MNQDGDIVVRLDDMVVLEHRTIIILGFVLGLTLPSLVVGEDVDLLGFLIVSASLILAGYMCRIVALRTNSLNAAVATLLQEKAGMLDMTVERL